MLGTNGEKHSVCVDGVVGPEHEDHIRGGRVVVVSVGASITVLMECSYREKYIY
jgi:hypothetical protein